MEEQPIEQAELSVQLMDFMHRMGQDRPDGLAISQNDYNMLNECFMTLRQYESL